jgi:uncharacterized repeat protein (TIGR01451 family)
MKRAESQQTNRFKRRGLIALQFALLLVLILGLRSTPAHAFAGVTVSGTVRQGTTLFYPDGSFVYVKLVQAGSVVAVATPDHVSGAYSFSSVLAGTYTVQLSNNSDPSDATVSNPLIHTFNTPSSGSQTTVVGVSNVTGVNFTLNYVCSCGYGDGHLTTGVTIPMTTNGDMSAWGSITSDSDNNSCDSTGPDRDAPIQSTGRDLLQFSYTYDSSSLYGYTTRVASESNTDNFIYYADTNNNGLMEAGEPVIYVSWQGSNRTVGVGVGQYVPKVSGGDPLANPTNGLADGYGMPGSITNGRLLSSGSWGSNTGTAMQWFVNWSDLGITPGTVIRWHISSTNTTPTSGSLANQIDDNMGGCGGCVASNQYGGVSISNSTNSVVPSNTTVYLPHVITNNGNGTDTFSFATTTTGPWTPTSVTYYKDNGTIGVFDGPAIDTPIANSGAILTAGSTNILVAVTTPANQTGTDTISFKATSNFIPTCGTGGASASATATDTIRVGSIISGIVYNDANHNGTIDSGEVGTSQTIYAKLISGSTLVSTVVVDPTTGAYTFPPQLPGTYSVVISNNNLATSLTATYPLGWVPVAPSTGTASITLATDTTSNFGLYHGSSVSSGTVFSDVGGPYPPSTPVATANNGIQDNASFEAGIQNVTVTATDSAGATTYSTATSDASGKFTLFIPSTATSLTIKKTTIASTQATGGTVGTTLGTYSRATESITGIIPVAGTAYTGVSFGSVPINAFTTDNTSNLQSGSSTYYPHTFNAGTIGSVTFTTSAAIAPAQTPWTEVIYRDKNCTGIFDSVNDTVISGAQALAAPGPYCILVQETVPAGVNGTNTVTITANFTYTNASPALAASLTRTDITTAGYSVSGSVYGDLNHNSTKDAGELGTGLTLYAKLVKNGATTAAAVATVDITTSGGTSGTYSFSSTPQPAGSYTIVLSTNNLATDITAILPSGYLGTQNPTGIIPITIAAADISNQLFGLYHGSSLTGTVFNDNGASAGIANNGIKDGGETGLTGVTITATNGATVYDTQTSVAAGTFTVWIPSTAASVTITRVATVGYMATGGSVGTTSGAYSRAQETITFTSTSGTAYTGVFFGDVPVNTLSNDNSGTLQQGTSNYYAHTFVSGSTGTVTFSTSAVSSPSLAGWVEAVYIDTNCNGAFDAGEPLATPRAVTSGSVVCVLVKETSPATGTGQNTVTLQASMTYTNATPALSTTLTRQDVTSSATGPIILIQKTVDKTQAYPGDNLTYTITYTNIGGFPARQMVINDSVPSSTTFVSATCGTPLPAALTACTLTQLPAVGGTGAVAWTFTGTLSPNGTGTVNFIVKVN